MTRSIRLQLSGKISLVLICAALGACASMQKSSSTGAGGEQAAAPVTDASQPSSAAKPSGSQGNSQGNTGATGAPSNAPGTSGAGGASQSTTGKPAAGAAGARSENEEAAQLKKQLEDQDAQINRLRNDQQANAAREDADAAKALQGQGQGQGQSQSGATGQSSPSGSPAAKAGSEDAAVFPDKGNAQQEAAGSGSDAVAPDTMERSIYFAYDQASVPEKYDDMLLANAAYLKSHPALKTEVQGNCDERGSREYNLALGARRAQSVKRALELAGADGSRIDAVSYGSEKPVALGKDEESYSKNRRADIVY